MKELMKIGAYSALIAIMAVCGCQSGLYKISTSEDGKKFDDSVRYCEIDSSADSFIKGNGSSPEGTLYDEDCMPIQIVDGRSDKHYFRPLGGWTGVLWMFSLGIFPICDGESVIQEISVKSPIGVKAGSYCVDARRWGGWIPIFIGYPAFADERDDDADLPNARIEQAARDRLVKSLVGEFSFTEYVAFAKKENTNRKTELARIQSVSENIDRLIGANKFDDAFVVIGKEAEARPGMLKCDEGKWLEMSNRVAVAHQAFDKKRAQTLIDSGKYEDAIEFCVSGNALSDEENEALKAVAVEKGFAALLKEVSEVVNGYVARNDFDAANALIEAKSKPLFVRSFGESGEWGDRKEWAELKELVVNKKEDYRVAKKQVCLEEKLKAKEYEYVLDECRKEDCRKGGRHAAVWDRLMAKAQAAIDERDRNIELARIEKHKAEVEELLRKKDYMAVIAECATEFCDNVGSRPEDALIWAGLRNQAEEAQDKIDRDAELSRIESKEVQIKKWLEEKNYDSVVAACDEERGTNRGARAEDMKLWRSYRIKAISSRILQKAANGKKSVQNIKGFSLGMSIDEVAILLEHYFPSITYTNDENQIKIDGHSMVFCQIKDGRIIRFNFNRDMLDKLFDYDVQDPREWAVLFAREYGVEFRGTTVRDNARRGGANISVLQDCYINRDRKNALMVSFFGEQDVSDYNKDPEEIEKELRAELIQMQFSGYGDASSAYNLGLSRGLDAENVKSVRKWLKEDYVNGKGAEGWTLRIDTLK